MESLQRGLTAAADAAFGPVTIILILGTGLYLTFGLRFLTIRRLPETLRMLVNPALRGGAKGGGEVSPLGALMTGLSAMLGTGKIAGVATAIHLGGPGALFWMWMTALVGMATRYAETLLAIKYREVTPHGHYLGGTMYYIKHGLGKKWLWLAAAYAIFTFPQAFGPQAQANTISDMLVAQFAVPTWATWAVLTISTFAVRIGGLQRLTKVASALVPIMVIFYMGGSALVLIDHFTDIPGAFALIFKSAFTGTAATGGFVGAGVAEAVRYGVARGIFSNEAGMGTTSIAHATAKSDDDVRQAALSMVGPFIDTIILCTVTGLVIILTGVWETGGTGAPLVARAFETVLPGGGSLIVTGAVLMFGLSVLWGWGLYGERAAAYLFGERAIVPSRYIYTITAPLGALLNVDTAWAFIDLSFAMMAAPNLIALILLSPVVFRTTLERLKGGAALIPAPAKSG